VHSESGKLIRGGEVVPSWEETYSLKVKKRQQKEAVGPRVAGLTINAQKKGSNNGLARWGVDRSDRRGG